MVETDDVDVTDTRRKQGVNVSGVSFGVCVLAGVTNASVSKASTGVTTCLSKAPGDAVAGDFSTGDLVCAVRERVGIVRRPIGV